MSVEDIHQRTDVPSEPSARFACLQKPIFLSEDFRTGAASLNENGPGMANFEGR
jgi:hypothetical protein